MTTSASANHKEEEGGAAVVPTISTVVGTEWDTIVSSLALQDKTPWYRKRNLRNLYLLFVGSVLCVETTSGYDSSVTNGLQSVPLWQTCVFLIPVLLIGTYSPMSDFHKPSTTILGLIGSMYALGVSPKPPLIPRQLMIRRQSSRSHSFPS